MRHGSLKILIATLSIVITLIVTDVSLAPRVKGRAGAITRHIAESVFPLRQPVADNTRRSNSRLPSLPLGFAHDIDH